MFHVLDFFVAVILSMLGSNICALQIVYWQGGEG